MGKQKLNMGKVSGFLHYFEVFLALVTVIFVVLGTFLLIVDIPEFYNLINENGILESFEEILSNILLLVVGIELAILLCKRTPESLIEVIFFVIARKMLITTDSYLDLFIGVAALAGLFAIRKYLTCDCDQIAWGTGK